MLSSAFHEISVTNFHLIAEYMTNEDKHRLMCACLKEMRKFLFVAGIMDVCRPEHALKEKIPVVYESSEYEDKWRMLVASTGAHVRVMDDLMRACEDGRSCNKLPNDYGKKAPALP